MWELISKVRFRLADLLSKRLPSESTQLKERKNNMGYKVVPKTAKDEALSKRHLKDTIAFNDSHAKDHIDAAKSAKKMLKDREKTAKKSK